VGLDRRIRGEGNLNRRRNADIGGLPFEIYKFRTMRVDAESGAARSGLKDDPRVTPIGASCASTGWMSFPS
jgi:lipopolysaccharide/colanic/teichoic acid biosynthesis glycosyltransferase